MDWVTISATTTTSVYSVAHVNNITFDANFQCNLFLGKYLIRPDDIPIDVFVTELAFYSLGRETVEVFIFWAKSVMKIQNIF